MPEASQRPNILLIMADELIPMLTGAYGHPVVQTPNLDRLVSEGVRFDAAYSPCPLCTPARAAMMTGRHVSEIQCYDNAAPFPVDEPTIAHYLALAGYDTVLSGKMHFVGPDQLHGLHRRLTTDVYPEDFVWLPERDLSNPAKRGHASQYIGQAIRVGEWHSKLSYDEETHLRAVEYLRAKARQQKLRARQGHEPEPFFLISSYHHPHEPFWPPKEFWDLYKGQPIETPHYPENLDETYSVMDRWLNEYHGVAKVNLKDPDSLKRVYRAYYALITYIDQKVGELLDVLDENGLRDNTVVFFVSDHGDMLCQKGMVQKRCFYEYSSRVAFIMRFPDGSHAGETIGEPTSLIDVLPTCLDMAGIDDRLPMDGQSVLGLLDGHYNQPRQVFSESHTSGVYGTCFMVRRSQYKYNVTFWEGGEEAQLFDLADDPGEWHNLASDPAHQELAADMRSRILAQFDPTAIEREIRDCLAKRNLLKKWVEATGTTWDYFPPFDARKEALDQYLG